MLPSWARLAQGREAWRTKRPDHLGHTQLECWQGVIDCVNDCDRVKLCRKLLTYIASAVTRNASEKKINSLLDHVGQSTDLALLQVHPPCMMGVGCNPAVCTAVFRYDCLTARCRSSCTDGQASLAKSALYPHLAWQHQRHLMHLTCNCKVQDLPGFRV